MSGKNINFDYKKIKKTEFYKNKKIFNIDDIDVNKIFIIITICWFTLKIQSH